MRAQTFISFQKAADEAFDEMTGPTTDEQDRHWSAICDAEHEALGVICRTETASLAEIADRAEILAASMEDDRFDYEVWCMLARRIADDLRAVPAAS